MCRSEAEGGRRCQNADLHNNVRRRTKADNNARKQISRYKQKMATLEAQRPDLRRVLNAQMATTDPTDDGVIQRLRADRSRARRAGDMNAVETVEAQLVAAQMVLAEHRLAQARTTEGATPTTNEAAQPTPEPADTVGAPKVEERRSTEGLAVPDADPAQAWQRVQSAGMDRASRDDLIAAQAAARTIAQRWDLQEELKRRAEDQARRGAQAAREAERTMSADRAAHVREALNASRGQHGDGTWVRLADVRAGLPADMSRAEVDAVFRQLSRSGDVTFAPNPDQKNHTLADHENGIWVGNENNHLVFWNERTPQRQQTAASTPANT